MLLSAGSEIIRLQSPFVDTPELDKVVEFIGSQRDMIQPISFQNLRVRMKAVLDG